MEDFYCLDCNQSHDAAQGRTHCKVCGRNVCASAYATRHMPQDFHQAITVLDGFVDSAADAVEQMADWMEEALPLGDRAKSFLYHAQELLVAQHAQMQQLRDKAQAACVAQKVG